MSMREARQRRLLRRELRREAMQYARDNPDWDEDQMRSHLEEEFGALPAPALVELILEVVRLLLALFDRD